MTMPSERNQNQGGAVADGAEVSPPAPPKGVAIPRSQRWPDGTVMAQVEGVPR